MKDISYFRKQVAAQNEEQDKLSKNLESLRNSRAALEDQINAAIDANDMAEVEKLTARDMELETIIRAAERTMERKKATFSLSKETLAAANNEQMKRAQDEINSVMQTARKYRRQYLENLIKAGKILKEANDVRLEYIGLSNTHEKDYAFSMVDGGFYGEPAFNIVEREILKEINPEEGEFLANMLRQ